MYSAYVQFLTKKGKTKKHIYITKKYELISGIKYKNKFVNVD